MKRVAEEIFLSPVNVLLFIAWLYMAVLGFLLMPIMIFIIKPKEMWKQYIRGRAVMWKHLYEDYY